MVSPPPKKHLFNPDNYICTLKSNICMQNAPHSCRHDTQRNNENNENNENNLTTNVCFVVFVVFQKQRKQRKACLLLFSLFF